MRYQQFCLADLSLLDGLQLLGNKPNEDLVRVQQAVVDPQSDQGYQQLEDFTLQTDIAGHCVQLQSFDDDWLKHSYVACQGGPVSVPWDISLDNFAPWN